jgi:CTP-dependent riboflavin kinase
MQGQPNGKGSWIYFSGEIVSGKGEGARFVQLAWVRNQIVNKIGFAPYPGTFNIKILDDAGREAVEKMRGSIAKAIAIIPPGGSGCYGSCFVAKIEETVDAAVIIPSEGGYEATLEFLAPMLVKNLLRLSDGDRVEVRVYVPEAGER